MPDATEHERMQYIAKGLGARSVPGTDQPTEEEVEVTHSGIFSSGPPNFKEEPDDDEDCDCIACQEIAAEQEQKQKEIQELEQQYNQPAFGEATDDRKT
jgi:hypothetical protein